MSKPQMKNGAKKKITKKGAMRPLISAIRHLFKGKPALDSRPVEKKPDHIAPLPKSIRFESLEPRVLMSADVNPAALTIAGDISIQGEQDRYEFTVDET